MATDAGGNDVPSERENDMRTAGLLSMTLFVFACASPAGQWLAADAPVGRAPFAPVPLFWFRVVRCPVVYRTVIDVPAGVDRATALLKTAGYVYVCVDGRQVYAWGAAKDSAERARAPGEPDRVHEIDLSEHLTPGRHVLTVSAPAGAGEAGGFVLDGGLYAGTKRVAPLASDATWTATVFRPTEVLEDHAIMTLAYDGKAKDGVCTAATKAKAVGLPWTAEEKDLAAAHDRAVAARQQRDRADATWRLELLGRKGIYVAEGAPAGWGGPRRPPIDALASRAAALLGLADVTQLRDAAEELTRQAAEADEDKALALAGRHPLAGIVSPATGAVLRRALEAAFGHPLGRLNESRHDRLGWLPHPHLTDGDLGAWGIRIHPVAGPTTVRLRPRWRFSTDPKSTGLEELRHTIGYNIEGQWPWIDGQQSWTRNNAFAAYQGVAWYRSRVFVPAEWAGSDVTLALRIAGTGRVWINDREVTDRRKDERTFVVPAGVWMFGTENFLAVRVEADGKDRGLIGPTAVSCPALAGPAGKDTPAVDALATPLSPCVVLAPRTDTLRIHHAGKGELLLPGGARKASYDAADDGKLKANWALLWLSPASEVAAERPILLVFQSNPARIDCAEGRTTVRLPRPGGRVIAVRPWAKALPPKADPAAAKAAEFWSRAALAVPVNYMTVTRVVTKGEPWENASIDRVPAGPVLGQTVIYDYLQTTDDWGTAPLRIAPVPALCSFAMDCKFRGLKLDDAGKVEIVQDGGLAAPYRAVRGAGSVSYSYPIEPWPRFVGFTSWMFAGSDTGVLGNEREAEIIAATGANSYRPQNNFADERSPHYPDDPRTRIRILADFCRGAGLSFMNNIDQTLGAKREEVRADYDGWVKTRLFPHYDKLVPQLKDGAFWEVAYDLINEPFDHQAPAYNRVTKQLTARVRKLDRRHLCYIEPCQAWGAIQQLRLIEPTGDPLTVYSFHDYNFRMKTAEDRWPTLESDVGDICRMWWPAFEFAIRHGVGMHCGEYGGFHGPTDDLLCQTTLLNDFLRVFDQFGMHHHYYTGRGVYQRQLDGSLRASNVVRAFRRYARRPDLNLYYKLWPGHPKPPAAN